MSEPSQLDAWSAALARELGIEEESLGHTGALLDVARDAAHAVARPAAPLTTFLVGWAVGTGRVTVDEGVAAVERLAARWTEEMPG
ncbi:DUF6457 domain-containing protein [Demequina sp. SYSU T00068]|uniref:DUF6457 domain-containing protein n=1 Tax=Demequina lignilytica TaxID=3051663 RepID=UPI0026178A08|nr:DUF6457 domain-containing protein [Demequina sp. SYSU T00068]MDN4489773.1 DUF6457 domain-containing protein [Demequina sp. SYSU T00068]